MTAITLSLDNLRSDDLAPLYSRYASQSTPQPAYVALSECGEVTAYTAGEINGTPMHVHHMRTLTWSVPSAARGAVLAALIQGEALPLLQRVHDGHSVQWDGSNHRGRLTGDAQDASDELDALFAALADDPTDLVPVWGAGDWLFSSNRLADVWSGRPLDVVAAELEAETASERVMIDGDMRAELLAAALRQFDEDGGDGLDAHHLAALVADGRITQAQADQRNAD